MLPIGNNIIVYFICICSEYVLSFYICFVCVFSLVHVVIVLLVTYYSYEFRKKKSKNKRPSSSFPRAALPCSTTPAQLHGHPAVCGVPPFTLGDACKFACDEGYELPEGGEATTECVVFLADSPVPQWDKVPDACVGMSHSPERLVIICYYMFDCAYSSVNNI